jgi:glycosyltransferase involved in cell wall biosynthesis
VDDAGDTSAPAARTPSIPGVVLRWIWRAIRAIGYGVFRLLRRLARPFVRRLRALAKRVLAKSGLRRAPGPVERMPVSRTTPEARPDPRLTELADARLVIAESPDAAIAAVHSGVPKPAVWLLAVPVERAAAGEPVPWAADLRQATPLIGGLLADSLDAAGILERVVAGQVRTVVFPPLAGDRQCETCKGDQPEAVSEPVAAPEQEAAAQSSTFDESAESGDSPESSEFPETVPEHLEFWRDLLAEQAAGELAPRDYSYAAARLLGEAGPWNEPARERWGSAKPTTFWDEAEPEPAPDWSSEAQRAGVSTLLGLVPSGEPVSDSPIRARVFGFDMRFMYDLAELLDDRPDLDVMIDEWRSAGARNDGITENLARSAQVLVADWVRPNAIWLSETKRPDQRLVVRLHRFEIDSDYPRRVQLDAVDAVVYIAPHMGLRIQNELGWPAEKLFYVPNYVPAQRLDRPKYPGAQFTLGMVGIIPGLKRFDLALDLLAAVRREDPRFSLLIRSQMGWAHKPSWEKPDERHQLQRAMERIEKDPLLRGAVVFDGFSRDMGAWYRKVGHILSLSDVEGSHTSVSEGMLSGAVPVVRGWEGAAEAYGQQRLCDTLDDAVKLVLQDADAETWQRRSAEAKQDAYERFDPDGVVEAWSDLLHGEYDQARERFARYML